MNTQNSVYEYEKPKNLASPLKRLFAKIVDLVIAIFLLYSTAHIAELLTLPNSIVAFLSFAIGGGYLLLSDALPNGQSIGKRIFKMSVVSELGYINCNIFQSFLRNIPIPFISVFDSIFIFFGSRKRLGDMFASTIVINS
jgi:uncharacterized RDD family membrane protein YckC